MIMLKVFSVLLVLPVALFEDFEEEAVGYLQKYGYIQTSGTEAGGMDDLSSAIKDFQDFQGLSPTGELDSETIELMKSPRCGIADKFSESSNFAQFSDVERLGRPWKKNTITYCVSTYPSNRRLSKSDVDLEIRKAFSMWEEAARLRFVKSACRSADIVIKWGKYNHGDRWSFDGRGRTLAHAFSPGRGLSGDAHFDDSENWKLTKKGAYYKKWEATQLLNTLTHEFGHSIGLGHKKGNREYIMAPYYKGWDRNLRLADYDKRAARELYGPPQRGRPTTTDRPDRFTTTSKPIGRPSTTNRPDRFTTRKPIGRPTSTDCKYTCDGGGCSVKYTGPPRSGPSTGVCFSSGRCIGTPPECQKCNQAISC